MDDATIEAIEEMRKIADELEAGSARVMYASVDVGMVMVRKNVEIYRQDGKSALSWEMRHGV